MHLRLEISADTTFLSFITLCWKKLWQLGTLDFLASVEVKESKCRNRDLLIAGRRLEDWTLLGPDSLAFETWRMGLLELQEEDLTNKVAEKNTSMLFYSKTQNMDELGSEDIGHYERLCSRCPPASQAGRLDMSLERLLNGSHTSSDRQWLLPYHW